MGVIVILFVLVVALFLGAFFSKRRLGVLGLGLTAGAVISPLWSENAGYVVSLTGLVDEGPLVNAIAVSALILIPAVLFMFHGYTYKHIVGRVIGSLIFTLFAAALLVGPIGSIVTLTGPVGDVYQWVTNNRDYIVSAGVIVIIVDFLFARTVQKSDKKHR